MTATPITIRSSAAGPEYNPMETMTDTDTGESFTASIAPRTLLMLAPERHPAGRRFRTPEGVLYQVHLPMESGGGLLYLHRIQPAHDRFTVKGYFDDRWNRRHQVDTVVGAETPEAAKAAITADLRQFFPEAVITFTT